MMRIPRATYRIQFTPDFGFREAGEILPYLSELGISDVYASPIFKSKKGSTHGYDVLDPTRLDPELGKVKDFHELHERAAGLGLGWIQDVVANHMAFDPENALLMDVLENGPRSRYARFFDIEWEHPYSSMKNRLLAPFLGRFYGESLESGEIKITYGTKGFTAKYYDYEFPLRIESYTHLLSHRSSELKDQLGEEHPDYLNYRFVLDTLEALVEDRSHRERSRKTKSVKNTLWTLYSNTTEIREFIDHNVALFNGEEGKPESFNLLDHLLSDQHFRLSFWKVAGEEINYRRFFNINQLISLTLERAEVFRRTHSMILEFVEKGRFTGLRIDHIDGLYDPARYLERLREKAPDAYLVVEKILDPEEALPRFWPVQGTTGYDFLNRMNGIFCRQENSKFFTGLYAKFTGLKTGFLDLKLEKKRLILEMHMAGDIDNLAHLLKAVSSKDRYAGDITLYGLKNALMEVMIAFPVYRTYINPDRFFEEDSVFIRDAVKRSKAENPDLENELRFIERFLLLEYDEYLTAEERERWIHFVMRFQQYTGPLMAKGVEDTAFYVFNRLISLNEVGGDPAAFGMPLEKFHEINAGKAVHWPHSMNTTATHDTKRGEDVRARINVLSEMPVEWEGKIKRWTKFNRKFKRRIEGDLAPDRNDEYFLYQTLIGACPARGPENPAFVERIKEYAIKAVREAKVHTAWLKPDAAYEEAFVHFIDRILDPSGENRFLKEFIPFQRQVAHYGIFNSLSQLLLKITSPGMPDFYQGTELFDLNLVDPDNRRPVDFEVRRSFLGHIRERGDCDRMGLIQELWTNRADGRIKMFLIHRALEARKQHARLFEEGTYIPLEVAGAFPENLVAFARRLDGAWSVTVAPRFLTDLVKEEEAPLGTEVWRDTRILLPETGPEEWRDMITDQSIRGGEGFLAGDALKDFPAALLVAEDKP